MKVKQLISQPVYTCRPVDSLHTAAQLMWDHDCGALPVIDGEGRVIAMITDRDACMAAYTQSQPLYALLVSVAMSKGVFACGPEDSIDEAERIMTEKQVRRLPVIDDSGHIVGLLSLNDIAREAAQERGRKHEVPLGPVATTLAGICKPRSVQAAAPAA